jgi:hypothetical protein
MGNNYIFSLTPTFTQGLVLGQLSILVLLALVLKYLFFIPPESETETVPFHPLSKSSPSWHQDVEEDDTDSTPEKESAHWFNILARQVCCPSLWMGSDQVSCNNRLWRYTELSFRTTLQDMRESRLPVGKSRTTRMSCVHAGFL